MSDELSPEMLEEAAPDLLAPTTKASIWTSWTTMRN